MDCDVEGEINDDQNLGKSDGIPVDGPENDSSKTDKKQKRKRKRPRTKGLRRKIRENIEMALCSSDSPIQDILETTMDCVVRAPLASVISLLKLDSDEYRKLSYEALISIGKPSSFFEIIGDTSETLRLVLKGSGLDHDATVVYVTTGLIPIILSVRRKRWFQVTTSVRIYMSLLKELSDFSSQLFQSHYQLDNLPHGCDVISLKRWASTFGTVVYVRPILEGKGNRENNSTSEVSTSAAGAGTFFQSAFIKFLDEQIPLEFIEFHRALRKKAANKRRKKLRLERLRAMGQKSGAAKTSHSAPNIKKKRKKKCKSKKTENVAGNQEKENDTDTVETEVTDVEETTVRVHSSPDATSGDGNHEKPKKRKRKLTSREAEGDHTEMFKATDAGNLEVAAPKRLRTEIPDINSSDDRVSKSVDTKAVEAIFPELGTTETAIVNGTVVNVAEAKRKVETQDEEIEVVEPAPDKASVLTKVAAKEPAKKAFEDVGTNTPEEFLLRSSDSTVKKRRRVHRQKSQDEKSKNRVSHLKKYFHSMQAYSLRTFQKLREKYLELQKQEMIRLKSDLEMSGITGAPPGLSKKAWKKKRGRSRLIMRAAEIREDCENVCHPILVEEDKLVSA